MQVLYFKSQCHYCVGYLFDIEHLTDSYWISSKTSANKASAFKTSASQHPSDMVAIESLRNLQNIA